MPGFPVPATRGDDGPSIYDLFIFSRLLLQDYYIGIRESHKRSNKVKHKEVQSPRRLTLAKMANASMPNAYHQMLIAYLAHA